MIDRVILQLILVASLTLVIFTVDDIFAANKKVTSRIISIEDTSIIEFTNNSIDEIKTIKIWLEGSSFISFKSQNDWTSPIASSNTITFITSEPLKKYDVAKFGIKTEKSYPLIKWESLNPDGKLIDNGNTTSNSSLIIPDHPKSNKDLFVILSNSTFKVIPKNLHPGSTIRVVGENFVPNSSLKLFFSDVNPKSFLTDENGNFVLTTKIPKNMKSEQVDFILKDKQENEKIITLEVTELEQKIPTYVDFMISEINDKYYHSENIEFTGTANPDSPLTMRIKDPQGILFLTKNLHTDLNGNWSISISIPLSGHIGEYTAEITDGKNTIFKSWDIVSSKKMNILPTKDIFKSGETIIFNGTAIPNEQINTSLIDPQGKEILTQNFVVDPSGIFEIKYSTLPSSSKGIYILYGFQKNESEIVFTGLDKTPQNILSVQLNDVNYHTKDVAIIGITGDSSQDVTLFVLDDNDHEKFTDTIKLDPNGKRKYSLPLTSFSNGVYTLLVSMANLQASDTFTVGLQSSHIPIDLNMIKTSLNPGQSISVTGTSQPETMVDLFLINSDRILINERETFVDKNGNISPSTFLIPYGESFGKWSIRAESGLNIENYVFQVFPFGQEGLSVRVTDIISSSIGKFVTIEGIVDEKQTVAISINDSIGNVVFSTNVGTTDSGEFDLLWNTHPESVGSYTVIVNTFEQTLSTNFTLN